MSSLLVEEPEKEAEEMLDGADDQECREEEEREEELERSVEMLEEEEEEVEVKAQMEMDIEKENSESVISDQPVSHGDNPVSQSPEIPPSSLPGLGVPCCQGQPDPISPEGGEDEETEPNNNTNKPPLLPESNSSVPSIPAPSARLSLNGKEAQKTGQDGKQDERTEKSGRDDLSTDRSQPHNALGARDEAAPRVEAGKRHSLKLRERLFQFPLCEKALAFNIPTHNKPKILPLAQYNCCHVL